MKEALAYLAIGVLMLFVLTKLAHGENRMFNVHLVVVQGEYSPPTEVQVALFKEGMERLKEVKVKPRIVSIKEVPDLVGANGINDYYYRLSYWSKLGLQKRNKGHTYFLLPPVTRLGVTYSGGQAGAICTTVRNKRKAFGEVSLRVQSSYGLPRQEHSKVVVLHEILHNLGAIHKDSKTVVISKDPFKRDFIDVANVMHSAAQKWVPAYDYNTLPIISRTRKQVKYCQRGLSVLGKPLEEDDIIQPTTCLSQ